MYVNPEEDFSLFAVKNDRMSSLSQLFYSIENKQQLVMPFITQTNLEGQKYQELLTFHETCKTEEVKCELYFPTYVSYFWTSIAGFCIAFSLRRCKLKMQATLNYLRLKWYLSCKPSKHNPPSVLHSVFSPLPQPSLWRWWFSRFSLVNLRLQRRHWRCIWVLCLLSSSRVFPMKVQSLQWNFPDGTSCPAWMNDYSSSTHDTKGPKTSVQ